jgi:hypothetical protein
MNLQEQISRMKSMMDLNESVPIFFRRRIEDLPIFITSTYKWLNPKAFGSFDEFMDRVVISTLIDWTSEYGLITDYDQIVEIRKKMENFVRQYIMDNYYDEIKDYYEKEINK